MGGSPSLRSIYELSVGREYIGMEYIVFGILFTLQSSVYGSTALFTVRDDAGRCYQVPACLFKIADARPSKWWLARQVREFDLALWPQEFYDEFFFDDLSEQVSRCVLAFERLGHRLESEFD